MTRNEANLYLVAILEVVALSPHGAPAGVLYAGMMARIGLDDFQALTEIAESAGLVSKAGHVLTITDKGRAMVAKIEAHRAKTAEQSP